MTTYIFSVWRKVLFDYVHSWNNVCSLFLHGLMAKQDVNIRVREQYICLYIFRYSRNIKQITEECVFSRCIVVGKKIKMIKKSLFLHYFSNCLLFSPPWIIFWWYLTPSWERKFKCFRSIKFVLQVPWKVLTLCTNITLHVGTRNLLPPLGPSNFQIMKWNYLTTCHWNNDNGGTLGNF